MQNMARKKRSFGREKTVMSGGNILTGAAMPIKNCAWEIVKKASVDFCSRRQWGRNITRDAKKANENPELRESLEKTAHKNNARGDQKKKAMELIRGKKGGKIGKLKKKDESSRGGKIISNRETLSCKAVS